MSANTTPTPLFVAGTWVTSTDVIDVHAPGDGRVVGQTYEATREMLEVAISGGIAAQATLRAQAPTNARRSCAVSRSS